MDFSDSGWSGRTNKLNFRAFSLPYQASPQEQRRIDNLEAERDYVRSHPQDFAQAKEDVAVVEEAAKLWQHLKVVKTQHKLEISQVRQTAQEEYEKKLELAQKEERETYERRLQQNTDMLTKEHSSYEANKMNMLNSAAIARGIDLPADGSFEHNFNLILKHVKMVDSESEKTRAENLQKAETALKESTIAHLEHVCVAMRLPSETFDSIPNLVKHIHHKALSLQDERDDLAHKVRDLSTSSESVKESIRQLVHHINTGHIIPVSQSTDATIKLLETTINQHYTTKLLAHDQDVRNEVLSTIKKACPRLGVAIKEPGNTSQLVEVFVDTVINKHDETAADCKDLVNHITQETEQRGFILHTGSNEKLKHYVVDLLTQIDKQTTATENNTQAVRDAKEQSDSTMSRIQQKIVKSSQTLLLPNPDMEADTETIVKTYVSAVTARVKKLLAERNDLDAHINRVITDISGMAMSDAKVIEAFKIVQELYDRIDALDKHLVATAKVLPPAPLQPSQNSTIERCTDYLASLETKVRELEKDEVTLNNEFDSVMRHCWSDTAAISDMSPQQRSTALIKEFDLRKTQKAELESIIDRSIKRLNQETQQPGIPSVGDMKLDERISAVLRALSDRLGVERESLKALQDGINITGEIFSLPGPVDPVRLTMAITTLKNDSEAKYKNHETKIQVALTSYATKMSVPLAEEADIPLRIRNSHTAFDAMLKKQGKDKDAQFRLISGHMAKMVDDIAKLTAEPTDLTVSERPSSDSTSEILQKWAESETVRVKDGINKWKVEQQALNAKSSEKSVDALLRLIEALANAAMPDLEVALPEQHTKLDSALLLTWANQLHATFSQKYTDRAVQQEKDTRTQTQATLQTIQQTAEQVGQYSQQTTITAAYVGFLTFAQDVFNVAQVQQDRWPKLPDAQTVQINEITVFARGVVDALREGVKQNGNNAVEEDLRALNDREAYFKETICTHLRPLLGTPEDQLEDVQKWGKMPEDFFGWLKATTGHISDEVDKLRDTVSDVKLAWDQLMHGANRVVFEMFSGTGVPLPNPADLQSAFSWDQTDDDVGHLKKICERMMVAYSDQRVTVQTKTAESEMAEQRRRDLIEQLSGLMRRTHQQILGETYNADDWQRLEPMFSQGNAKLWMVDRFSELTARWNNQNNKWREDSEFVLDNLSVFMKNTLKVTERMPTLIHDKNEVTAWFEKRTREANQIRIDADDQRSRFHRFSFITAIECASAALRDFEGAIIPTLSQELTDENFWAWIHDVKIVVRNKMNEQTDGFHDEIVKGLSDNFSPPFRGFHMLVRRSLNELSKAAGVDNNDLNEVVLQERNDVVTTMDNNDRMRAWVTQVTRRINRATKKHVGRTSDMEKLEDRLRESEDLVTSLCYKLGVLQKVDDRQE